MIRHHVLEPRFVVAIPQVLEAGALYVSMEYGTVVHSCCCGCGREVVTPLTPTDWSLSFDGEAISLKPSVGNWNLPCRSHYVISRNRVIECGNWNQERIDAERRRDRTAKSAYYQKTGAGSADHTQDQTLAPSSPSTKAPHPSWMRRLLDRLRKI